MALAISIIVNGSLQLSTRKSYSQGRSYKLHSTYLIKMVEGLYQPKRLEKFSAKVRFLMMKFGRRSYLKLMLMEMEK
jgi:hypothetical protein